MRNSLLIILFISFFFYISCTKIETNSNEAFPATSSLATLATTVFENHDDDSIERITVLGAELTNPYLIPNMTQAYHNLGIYNVPVVVTNLYVRFKPTNVDQLSILDSTMEVQNLELFDTPADFDVLYEGDYYQDPSIPEEQITWQYAVVPPAFVFPTGIQHETLAQIHIPGDNYTAVETEAEDLAAGGAMALSGNVQPNIIACLPGYHYDIETRKCIPDNCPAGYHWNGTACVIDQTTPPPPAVDAAVPAGNIKVHDTQIQIPADGNLPVRKARIVARRWFKIERVFTDNNGHFQCAKRFKHKVRINVKFKNDDAVVRGLRGVRLWQMLFPVKKTLGVFSGDKSNIAYTFLQYTTVNSKGNRYWAGATTHNAVQEYRDYAVLEGIGLPPTGLKIILSNWGNGGGASPMWAKRGLNSLPSEFVLTFLATTASPIAGGITALIVVLKHQIDVGISYNVPSISLLSSDNFKEGVYHELTHTAHYAVLGNSWYTIFADAEITQIVANLGGAYSPYGNGQSGPIQSIALAEAWAYYMGHYLADKTYGVTASCQKEQDGGSTWCNTSGTFHPHLDVEENFNPNLAVDRFEWIPQGLFYDLRDPANETIANFNFVNDYVSGYTNSQMFSTFQSNIFTLQDYRARLLQTISNTTSLQVTGLFAQYHY